jgi:hypothetical protein
VIRDWRSEIRKKFVFFGSYPIRMQEKIITIPFNYNEFLKSQKTIWSYSLKKVIDRYIIYSIIPIIILAIGIKTELKDPFPLATIIGCVLLIYILIKWSGLYQSRKKFFKRTEAVAKRYAKDSIERVFVFYEDKIEYQDKEKLYKLNWSLFKPYIVFKDYIFLIAKDSGTVMFTISKSEVGDENYSEMCDILKEKIGFDKVLK